MPVRVSRRQANTVLLGSLMTGLARPTRADTAENPPGTGLPSPKQVKYFTAGGAGSYTGDSWQDAMPIVWLKKSLPLAVPGMAYYIGLPRGTESVPFQETWGSLATSGEPGNPIQILAGRIGQGNKMEALATDSVPLLKSAKPWSLDAVVSHEAPQPPLQIINSASHIVLSGFVIDGTGVSGLVRFVAKKGEEESFEDIVISDIVAQNVGRVIETTHGTTLRHLTVENCSATAIVRGFARFWDLSDSTFRKITLDAGNLNGGIKNSCELIAWEKGENVVFEDIVLKNAVNTPLPGDNKTYIQGDGIVTERETKNVTIRRCHASHLGDGGFDLKTTNVTIEDSSAEGCKFGARIWSDADNVIRRCSFKALEPVQYFKTACVQASGRVEIMDTTMEVGPGTYAIELGESKNENPPAVKMTGGSITIADGGKLVEGRKRGVLELNNVSVNGETKTQRIEI